MGASELTSSQRSFLDKVHGIEEIMAITKQRPVFLDLTKIRLPLVGYLSILHRISGVLLFLAIPCVIYLLQLSVSGSEGFAQAAAIMDNLLVKLFALGVIWSLCHHLLAGIRFLLIDFDLGVEKESARTSAKLVIVVGVVLALIVAGGLL